MVALIACAFIALGRMLALPETSRIESTPVSELVQPQVVPQAAPPWPVAAPLWKLACPARIHFAAKAQDLLVRVLRQPKWRARPLQVTLLVLDLPLEVLTFVRAHDRAVALETLEREAAEESKPIENHLTHLIVHGVLHLLGYDHEDDDEAETLMAYTGQRVASKAFYFAAVAAPALSSDLKDAREEIQRLRRIIARQQQVLENARQSAALLLEVAGQGDLFMAT